MKHLFARISLLLVSLALASAVTACGNGAPGRSSSDSAAITGIDESSNSLQGSWYGTDVRLSIDSSGATFQFNCASGSISGPMTLDANDSFSLSGTYSMSMQTPSNETYAATYSGAVTDSGDINLTVTDSSSGAVLGSYQLTYGTTSPLESCL